jgi:prepilin-type N-terminal cleavage/methylation domain-containing protein
MFSNQRSDGFTLFEVIIAVALVAIMAVAIAPPLIKNLNEGKTARAQSDAQVIGNAIQSFYKDTGKWPLQDDNDPSPELVRLVGNASLGGGNSGLPDGDNNRTDNWQDRGRSGTLTNQLILNESENGNIKPLYQTSSNPHRKPGWNGPYLDEVPLDPWGNAYVVNIHYTSTSHRNNLRHNVMVLSAGPNQVFETTFADNQFNEEFGGDDIGYVIRGSNHQ